MYNYIILFFLFSCALGSDYTKPTMDVPEKFQEGDINWKTIDKTITTENIDWWEIFENQNLNSLEDDLNKNNYNIKSAEASYRGSLYLVEEARAAYLPSINLSSSVAKQKASGATKIKSYHNSGLTASWEPDLWGNVSRNIEMTQAEADITDATMQSTKLSTQSSLAQYYFELIMLDKDQYLLDQIVKSYTQLLDYTKKRSYIGVENNLAVNLSEQQLLAYKDQAINNNITRAQYQHAIAVLIGESPSVFRLSSKHEEQYPDIQIPISVPSSILERRPDIYNAERQVAKASANIGLTKSAFFPILDITGSYTPEGSGLGKLLSLPISIWSFGPSIALDLTNLVVYNSSVNYAKENYDASVFSYKNTVLTAFQDVEDNMVALRILTEQVKIQQKTTDAAKHYLDMVVNQYNAGIVDKSSVWSAEISYYTAAKTLNDTIGLKMTSSVGLIKALGGVWDQEDSSS